MITVARVIFCSFIWTFSRSTMSGIYENGLRHDNIKKMSNFQSFEVVSRYRDPQLQVTES